MELCGVEMDGDGCVVDGRRGERVDVVRGEPASSGGGVLWAAEAVRRGLLGPRLEQN